MIALNKHLGDLKASVEDEPTLAQMVEQLDELTQIKLSELNDTIAMRKNDDAVGAIGLVHTGAGKNHDAAVRVGGKPARAAEPATDHTAPAVGRRGEQLQLVLDRRLWSCWC